MSERAKHVMIVSEECGPYCPARLVSQWLSYTTGGKLEDHSSDLGDLTLAEVEAAVRQADVILVVLSRGDEMGPKCGTAIRVGHARSVSDSRPALLVVLAPLALPVLVEDDLCRVGEFTFPGHYLTHSIDDAIVRVLTALTA